MSLLLALTGCSSIEGLSALDGLRKRMLSGSADDIEAAYASNDLRNGVPTLEHQLSWRAQSFAVNPSFDPQRRPRRVPHLFQHVPWTYDIPLISPQIEALLTSDFGWRNLYGRTDYHSGIDIAAGAGTRIYTPVSGEVLYVKHAGTDSGLVVSDGDRQHTFWHTRPARGLRKGQWIASGSVVGTMVPWGSRTHLHYSVHLTGPSRSHKARNDSNAIDPLTLVKRLQETVGPWLDEGVAISSLFQKSSTQGVADHLRLTKRLVGPGIGGVLAEPYPLSQALVPARTTRRFTRKQAATARPKGLDPTAFWQTDAWAFGQRIDGRSPGLATRSLDGTDSLSASAGSSAYAFPGYGLRPLTPSSLR